MARKRRTKKQYIDLYNNPESLFENVETVLFPNGEPRIWFETKDGLGFEISVSNGPFGLSLTVRHFVGTPKITVQKSDSGWEEVDRFEMCQYRREGEWFRERYFKKSTSLEEITNEY